MKLSPRSKYHWVLVGCILVTLVFGVNTRGAHITDTIVLLFFAWVFVASYLLWRIRCTSCGASVSSSQSMGFVWRNCKSCGADLTKE